MAPRMGTVGDAVEGVGILEEVGRVNKGKTIVPFILLWGIFAIFFVLYLSFSVLLWPVLLVWASALSVYTLLNYGRPQPKQVGVSLALALAAAISTSVASRSLSAGVALVFASTLVCSMAMFGVHGSVGGFAIIRGGGKGAVLVSIVVGLVVGVSLGVVNCLFGMSNAPIAPSLSMDKLIASLSPAIMEEVVCRAAFMVFCLATYGRDRSRPQALTMRFMMVVPHTLAHQYGLVESAVLALLFGLPFTVLQRRRDVASAMIAHGLVDLMRFVVFGR